jgi:chromosome segregation ATPase
MLKHFVLLLLCFFLLVLVVPIGLTETKYEISEQQLNQLIQNLKTLKNNCELQTKVIKDLKTLTIDQKNLITTLQAQLLESAQIIQASKKELEISKESIIQAENLLIEAQESFEMYKKQVEKEIKRLKRERNAAIIGGIVGWVLFFIK